MDNTTIYIILIINIYILYLTIKYKYTVCPDLSSQFVEEPAKPIKVSQIFSKMFQDPSPVPGNISLNIGSELVPNI